MTKREKRLWILYGGILLFLFLLSSTDLILKEKEPEIYPIAVIIEDAADDNYVNFRKGMERAAMELNADVRFITLYEDGNRAQQEELMLREQQDGSRALIVSPVDLDAVILMRSEKRITVPIVLLNSEYSLTGDNGFARLSFDYYGMGRVLGEKILEEHGQKQPIYLVGEKGKDRISSQFQQGILDVLEPAGCKLFFVRQPVDELQGKIEKMMGENLAEKPAEKELPGEEPAEEKATEKEPAGEETTEEEPAKGEVTAIIVALDSVSLAEMARILTEQEEIVSHVDGLYGRGNTVPILNYLDKGIIKGLCVTDDFSLGYLSVTAAVDLAGGHSAADVGYLDSHYIQKEDLRKEEYEKMLYPIE